MEWWRAWAKWPGLEPILMGYVWGRNEDIAYDQAQATWPQVPDWDIR